MPKDFFISYNHNDKAWAEWIAWHLEETGHPVVLQEWDFVGGGNFVTKMDLALAGCERTLAVLSPDYLTSAACTAEWTAALRQDLDGARGLLCAVRVRECEPKGLLGPIAYFDLAQATDEPASVQGLLAYVRKGRGKPKTPPAFPPAQRAVASRPRFPGALPPIWNLPHPRNPNFTGREDLLAQIHASLTSGRPAALTQTALAGLGGIGKTQLANEYAYRHADEYEVVWWIRSEEPARLASDYAGLAAALGLPEKDEQDQRVIIAAVRAWLEHNTKWLLVGDNVPHPHDIEPYLPRGGAGHVLITSRDQNWRGLATPVTVPRLSRAESIAFLEKWLGRPEPRAGELAQEMDDFPLALAQAAAYMEATQTTVADYLDLYRARRKDLWRRERPPRDYPDTVETTWSMAMTNLRKECPAALDLLRLCAFLAPDDIPISMLQEAAEDLPRRLAKAAKDPLALGDVFEALRRYSLAEVRDDSLSLHRLLQAVVQDGLREHDRRKRIEAAAETVNAAFPSESGDVRTWPACARLLPHGLAASDWAEPSGVAPAAVSRILDRTATYLQERAEFAVARDLFVRALALREKTYGPDHLSVAASLGNLGSVLQDLGDLQTARAHYERALAIDEKAHGADHPEVAISVNNLGDVLRALGDLEGAKAHLERALAIDEKAYGPDHPHVATDVNNLGGVLHALGDLHGAKAHFERALTIDEKAYGPDHPSVARDLHNLGSLHAKLGNVAEARDLLTRALRINERFLGKDHPRTATTRKWLASLPPAGQKAAGKPKRARR